MVAVAPFIISFVEATHTSEKYLPNNGLSEVTGIVADTMFKNTVRLRRIVTPGMKLEFLLHLNFTYCVYTNFSARSHANNKSATFVCSRYTPPFANNSILPFLIFFTLQPYGWIRL